MPAEVATAETSPPRGVLPAWRTANLPEPPPFTPRNAFKVIGPGALLLAFSLGAGEWLFGPAALARHGPTILWIPTASILLQALLNTEMARYTLYTGEPIFTGFMRTAPGPTFWGWTYAALHFLQVGWPGWGLAAATAVSALFLGRIPDEADRVTVLYFGYFLFLTSVLLVLLAERVEQTLEYTEWFTITGALAFLILAGVFLVPLDIWEAVGLGFVAPLLGSPPIRGEADWLLLAGLAAYSGAGGTNATLTHWIRDKGFGMSGTVGAVPAIIGGQRVNIAQTGVVFPPTPENLRRWKGWWAYLRADQWFIWLPGSLIGMGLPVLIALAFLEPGTPLGGYGIAAYLAQALAERFGPVLWGLGLLIGFWILFSTQLTNAGGFTGVITDVLWTVGGKPQEGRGGDYRATYYRVLLAFTLWGCVAIALADPLVLLLIGANIAGGNLVVLSLHTLVLNRKFLPPEVHPPLWRQVGLVLCALFFFGLVALALIQRIPGMG